MNIKSFANYLCATALALLSAVANAGPVYKFELTGAYAATWLLTVPVVPDDTFSGQQFTLWNVVGSFEKASTSKADITFFNTAEGGGLNLYDFAAHGNLLSTDGPQLYTGTEGSPIFNLGAYALTQFQRASQYTLVISEVSPVPEPASLALTVCGLVGIAAATRRRRRTMRD